MTRVERIEPRVEHRLPPATGDATLERDVAATVEVVAKTKVDAQPPDLPSLTAEAIKQHYQSLADGLRAMLAIEKRQHEEFVRGTESYIAKMLQEGDDVAKDTEERLLATKCRAEAISQNGSKTNGAAP